MSNGSLHHPVTRQAIHAGLQLLLPVHPHSTATLRGGAKIRYLMQRTGSRLDFALLLWALLCLSPAAQPGQGASATVSGFVIDPSGAKIPSATVTFVNTATGVSGVAITNGAGLYRLSGLIPGPYRSTVSVQGFKTLVRDGIDLHI